MFWVDFILPFCSYFLTPLGLLCVICDVSVFAFLWLSSVHVIGPNYWIGPMRFDPVLACLRRNSSGCLGIQFLCIPPYCKIGSFFAGFSAVGPGMVYSFSDLSKYALSISLCRICCSDFHFHFFCYAICGLIIHKM